MTRDSLKINGTNGKNATQTSRTAQCSGQRVNHQIKSVPTAIIGIPIA